jgi:predicted Zn-dependent peptidase
MEKPVIKKLKNGFVIGFIPHKGVKSLTLQLRGLAGSNYEEKGQTGASHLAEHLSVERKEREEILFKGGKIVAMTSRDEVLYMVKVLREDLAQALRFYYEVFSNTDFKEKRFVVDKNITKEEIKRFMNVPEKMIARVSYQLMFPGQRIGGLNTGSNKDLNKLDLDDVVNFKRQNYVPNRFCLTISGDMSSKVAISRCEKVFGKFRSGPDRKLNLTVDESLRFQNTYNNFYTQSHIKVDYYGLLLSNPLHISSLVLAKCIDNYLKSELKIARGLVYNTGCESFCSENYGVFSLYCATDYRNTKQVLKLFLNIRGALPVILNTRNVSLAKNQIVTDMEFSYEKTSFRADFYSQLILSGQEACTFDDEVKKIRKVTVKDLVGNSEMILEQKPKITLFTKNPFNSKINM